MVFISSTTQATISIYSAAQQSNLIEVSSEVTIFLKSVGRVDYYPTYLAYQPINRQTKRMNRVPRRRPHSQPRLRHIR